MNDDDLKKIGKLITDSERRVKKTLEKSFEIKIEDAFSDSQQRLEERLTKKINQAVIESEERTAERIKESGERTSTKIEESIKKLSLEIGQFVDDSLLPQIAEKADKSDIKRLERKLDYYIGKTEQNEKDIEDIKSVPVVAHHLKVSK